MKGGLKVKKMLGTTVLHHKIDISICSQTFTPLFMHHLNMYLHVKTIEPEQMSDSQCLHSTPY